MLQIMNSAEFNSLWGAGFAHHTKEAIPSYSDFLIAERMLEDYLDIFRGHNTRESGLKMPYPHPFFDTKGNSILSKKPCIKYILIGEARPPKKGCNLNDCGGDKSNTFFYDIRHIKSTPWLNAPRINWGCSSYSPCPNDKIQTLLCLASKGVLLLDLFPFAVSYSSIRNRLNDSGLTKSYWDNPKNSYNLQDRIKRISKVLCKDWDLTFVAPCLISEFIINPSNGFNPLTINPIGNHPTTFRLELYDESRCVSSKFGHEWKKIAVSQIGPSAHLLGLSF